VEEYRDVEFDFVITVCDNAARDYPVGWGQGRAAHVEFPDPAAATGSETEQLEAFRQVRDSLRREPFSHLERLEGFVSESEEGLNFHTLGNL
jgi:arsenate reductase